MIFQECKDTISMHVDAYLQTVLTNKGLNVQSVVAHHREIVTQFKDSYSRALLLQGLPKEEAPTFSNVPTTSFKWASWENLEEIFQMLQLPATQQRAHRLTCQLRTKTLTDILSAEQLEKLLEVPFIKEVFDKAASWLIRASGRMVAMSANFPLTATVTEEEKAFSKLLEFDWYYSYSDDITVWRAGKDRHAKAVLAIRAVLEEKPELEKVVATIAASNNLSVTFFTKLL